MNRTWFWMHDNDQKMHHVVKDNCGVQGGSRGAKEGKQGKCRPGLMFLAEEKTIKRTGRQNETRKPGRTNMATHAKNCKKKWWHESGKKKGKQTSVITKGKRKTKHYLLCTSTTTKRKVQRQKTYERRGSSAGRNLQKTKNTNVSNLPKKNKQAVHTSIAKNKASRQMHI